MLIIFDLDDTLIDTSGAITPFKLQECLNLLLASGVSLPENALEQLLHRNSKAEKSTVALIEFAKSFHASDEQIAKAMSPLNSILPDSFQIPLTPNAKEILEYFKPICPMAIVTSGHPPYQMDKLKKAGIEPSIFSMIAIPEDSVKKPHYEALQKKFNIPSKEIWVCGDRMEMDLRPAFELGMNTIHMRWGRGKDLQTEEWVNHSINNLSTLKEIHKRSNDNCQSNDTWNDHQSRWQDLSR